MSWRSVAWAPGSPTRTDPSAAQRVLADYLGLIQALADHALLLRAGRVSDWSGAADRPETRERDRLPSSVARATAGATSPREALRRVERSGLCRAAVAARAATDLVATHVDHLGDLRGPELVDVLTTQVGRSGAAREGFRCLDTTLGAADTVARAALSAGLDWSQVRQALPDLGLVRDAVRAMTRGEPGTDPHLQELTVAVTAIRTTDPLEELADRLVRLRRAAWAHAQQSNPPVADLKTFATLGAVIAAHAHAADTAPASDHGGPLGVGTASRRPAWDEIRRAVDPWRNTGLPDGVAAVALRAVGRLLRDLAPLDGQSAGRATVDRSVDESLRAATSITGDVARWNQKAIERLHASGEVFTDATRLPRDLVSARPDLAAARLARTRVHVPGDVLATTAWLYYAAGAPAPSSRTREPEPVFARVLGPTGVENALTRIIPSG